MVVCTTYWYREGSWRNGGGRMNFTRAETKPGCSSWYVHCLTQSQAQHRHSVNIYKYMKWMMNSVHIEVLWWWWLVNWIVIHVWNRIECGLGICSIMNIWQLKWWIHVKLWGRGKKRAKKTKTESYSTWSSKENEWTREEVPVKK